MSRLVAFLLVLPLLALAQPPKPAEPDHTDLIRRIQDSDTDWQRRNDAIWEFRCLDRDGQAAVARALVAAFREPTEWKRTALIERFSRLGPVARPALLDGLKSANPAVRRESARVLAWPEMRTPEAFAAAVAATRADLRNPVADVRRQAIETLTRLGPGVDGATGDFVRAMDDPDPGVRATAATTLGQIQPMTPATVAALRKAVGDKEPSVAGQALSALCQVAPGETETSDLVLRALRTEALGSVAEVELGHLLARGQLMAGWLRALEDKDPAVRVRAVTAPAHQQTGSGVLRWHILAAIGDRLVDTDEQVRNAAESTIGTLADVPFLRDRVRHPNLQVRIAVVRQLTSRIGAPDQGTFDPDAARALGPALLDPDPDVRANAVGTLAFCGSTAVPYFIRALEDKDRAVRLNAAQQFGQLGMAGAPATPALAAVLKAEDKELRLTVLPTLANLKGTAREAVPAVRRLLKDKEDEVRAEAVRVLGEIGAPDRETVAALTEASRDPQPTVRRAAVAALGTATGQKDAQAALEKALADPDGEVVAAAAAGLLGFGKDTVPILRKAVAKPEFAGRAALGTAILYHPRPLPTEYLPLFVDLLKDSPAEVRQAVLYAIRDLGKQARTATPAVLETLTDPSEFVRSAALEALRECGAGNEPTVVAAMKKALSDGSAQVRMQAVVGLLVRGRVAKDVFPDLRPVLTNRDVFGAAVPHLTALGKDALPLLLPIMKDREQASMALWAARVVLEIDPRNAEVLPAILGLLKEGEIRDPFDTTSGAIFLIGELGPNVKDAVPVLVRLMKQPGEGEQGVRVRWSAITVLGNLGPMAEDAIPELLALLKSHAQDHTAVNVAEALARMGTKGLAELGKLSQSDQMALSNLGFQGLHAAGVAAVPEFVAALKSPRHDLRRQAVSSLQSIAPKRKELIPTLVAALGDSDRETRIALLTYLVSLEPATEQVEPGIRSLLKDPDPVVRALAAAALGSLGIGDAELIEVLFKLLKHPGLSEKGQAALTQLAIRRNDLRPLVVGKLYDPRDPSFPGSSLRQYPNKELADAARDRVPVLRKALGDPDPGVRRRALELLNGLAPHWRPEDSRRDLLALVRDEESVVRQEAYLPLVQRHADDAEAWKAMKAAWDRNEGVMYQGYLSLVALMTRTPERKRDLLNHPSPEVRRAAFQPQDNFTIPTDEDGVFPPEVTLASALGLGDRDPQVRQSVAQVLENNSLEKFTTLPADRRATLVKVVVPVLSESLRQSGQIRRTVAKRLGDLGPDARDAVPDLLKVLQGAHELDQLAILDTLGRIGPGAREAIPALQTAGKDSNRLVQQRAVVVLARVTGRTEEALAFLLRRLDDPDTALALDALKALPQLGNSPAVAAALARGLRRTWSDVDPLFDASLVLRPYGSGVLPVLELLVSDPDENLPILALSLASEIAPKDKKAVALLERAAGDHRAPVRNNALVFLAQLPGEEVVPLMARALKDPEVDIRLLAAETLAARGARAAEVLPVLRGVLNNETRADRRQRAATGLGQLGEKAVDAVPDLLTVATDSRSWVRQAALRSLRQIAPDNPAVRTAWEVARRDTSFDVRRLAAEGLSKPK